MTWVGVDGGGTRSRAWVTDRHGRKLGGAEGGPGLVHPANPAAAAPTIEALVRTAVDTAGASLPACGLWAGLAGAGREGPRKAVETALRESGIARRTRVGTDVQAAHADAFREGPGILLVAGTGSVVLATDPHGTRVTVGGWGSLLGDEGSGYRIGLQGLRAVVRSADGREPETALTTGLLRQTGTGSPGDLAAWAAVATKGNIAALSVPVIRAAHEGDPAAAKVIRVALGGIRALLEATLRRTGGWKGAPPVAFVGGLVTEGSPLRDFVDGIAAELGCGVLQAPVVPERGAARKAIALAPPGRASQDTTPIATH